MRVVKLGLLVGVPGSVGYYSGRYIGGSGFYTRTDAEMTAKVTAVDPYTPHTNNTEVPEFNSVVKTTVPHKDGEGAIVSHAFCSQKAVGFPFMVHGGLLASLVKQQIGNQPGTLSVRYLNPTFIDQVLKFETKPTKDGSVTRIFESYTDKPLVEATFTKKGWLW